MRTLLLPECRAAGCEARTNGTHRWTNHDPDCPRYRKRTRAECGRIGGLVGGRPRKGKYPRRMPWWEQALRDHAEHDHRFPLNKVLEILRIARTR